MTTPTRYMPLLPSVRVPLVLLLACPPAAAAQEAGWLERLVREFPDRHEVLGIAVG